MRLYKVSDIQAWDRFTIEKEPIASIDLMERAAQSLCNYLVEDFPDAQNCLILCGPGNNGGDGLAMVRMLKEMGRNASAFLFDDGKKISGDAQTNLDRLNGEGAYRNDLDQLHESLTEADLIVDALFGSGLQRPLGGVFAQIVHLINGAGTEIVAVDVPSGLFADAITAETDPVVEADMVYTFQVPKRSLLLPENRRYVSEIQVVDIGLHPGFRGEGNEHFHSYSEVLPLPERDQFARKGEMGRVAIMAGSKGMAGAAILCSRAALRSGCGLCTTHIPKDLDTAVHLGVPEATLRFSDSAWSHDTRFSFDEFHAVGIGPGLGTHPQTQEVLKDILTNNGTLMVLDADALNIIAENGWHEYVPEGSVLTPHPKEFERLFGKTENSFEAYELQVKMSVQNGWIIVRKGAFTTVSLPNGGLHFNGTGNSGMAKGGSGDVLTGVITSLIAQGLTPADAAISGVFYHGLAGDHAAADLGEINMLASDICDRLFLVP